MSGISFIDLGERMRKVNGRGRRALVPGKFV
ncbi:hypothetical protein I656_03178 [Geobacillus sp. WSUCF1]|nr:hypothetical protein I656_03178 [Geobacillus sp. WSUCF1]